MAVSKGNEQSYLPCSQCQHPLSHSLCWPFHLPTAAESPLDGSEQSRRSRWTVSVNVNAFLETAYANALPRCTRTGSTLHLS